MALNLVLGRDFMYSSGRTVYVLDEPAVSMFRVKKGGNRSSETSQKKKLMACSLVDMHRSFIGPIGHDLNILSRIFHLL